MCKYCVNKRVNVYFQKIFEHGSAVNELICNLKQKVLIQNSGLFIGRQPLRKLQTPPLSSAVTRLSFCFFQSPCFSLANSNLAYGIQCSFIHCLSLLLFLHISLLLRTCLFKRSASLIITFNNIIYHFTFQSFSLLKFNI